MQTKEEIMYFKNNLLITFLFLLAVFVNFNFSHHIPKKPNGALDGIAKGLEEVGIHTIVAALGSKAVGSAIAHISKPHLKKTLSMLSSDEKREILNDISTGHNLEDFSKIIENMTSSQLGKLAEKLSGRLQLKITQNLPQADVKKAARSLHISSGLPNGNPGVDLDKLPAEQVGILIKDVDSKVLGSQLKELSDEEFAAALGAIPPDAVKAVLDSVPKRDLRTALAGLSDDQLRKILQSKNSLGSVPDDKLTEVAARLGAGLINIAHFFPAEQDGHLLAKLPATAVGNFVKGLSPDDMAKFAGDIPTNKLMFVVGPPPIADDGGGGLFGGLLNVLLGGLLDN